ncbi:MAG: cyclic nucleotide-binding domain-containing protein [Acidobacteria bacterium]|nr:cyclic nucleotide-binding domain-containing protein [Acidobacteriota bacterium]
MRTSTIAYRVADFLHSHAPFQYTPESELVELARSGRVKFYEADEYIFRQDELRKPWIYVIQQGRVELWEEGEDESELRDILGAGDLLGIGAFWGDPPSPAYIYSAKTTGDVVLYALALEAFSKLVEAQPRVARYLNAYFSVNPIYNEAEGELPDLDHSAATSVVIPLESLAHGGRLLVRADESVADIVRRTASGARDTVVLIDEQDNELGVVWLPELAMALADGRRSWDGPAASAATARVVEVDRRLSLEDTHLAMLRARRFVALVRDPDGRACGTVSPTEIGIMPRFNPALTGRRLRRAADIAEARVLIHQAKLSIAAELTDRTRVGWLADVSTELHALLIERLAYLAVEQMAAEGWAAPAGRHCWILFGSAGRGELLTWHDLDFGLIFDLDHGDAAQAQKYYLELGWRVVAGAEACGFVFSDDAQRPDRPECCRSLRAWRNQFSGWIRDPVKSRLYEARSMFDLQYAADDRRLLDQLRDHIRREVAVWDGFIRILAHDTLAHLPPLTFFDGLVVEGAGRLRETLDLKRSAIFPLSDAARVWGLSIAAPEPASVTRLLHAGEQFPEHAQLFHDASEALRIALYQRGRVGLRDGSDGALVSPRELSKLDQQLLKSAFRTAADLLRATAERFHPSSPELEA